MKRAKAFYKKLLGWKIKGIPEMPDYELFSLSKNSGGALTIGKTGTNSMLPYFHVKSIENVLKNAKSLKAKIVAQKTEIGGGHGFFALIKDTEGNTIGVWNKK